MKHIRFSSKKLFDTLKYYAKGYYNKLDEDHVWVLSSSIAFNIIICTIPITLILISILGVYLNRENTGEAINQYLNTIVGLTPALKEKILNIVFSAVDEISSYQTLTFIIGMIGVLWTASGLFSTIRDVLNRVFKTRYISSYIKDKLKDIFMVLLVIIVFTISFAATFVYSVIKSIEMKILGTDLLSGFGFESGTFIFGLLFTFIMFYLIFKIVPHGKVDKKTAIVSSTTATISYTALKYLFIWYLISFATYERVYGAYAAFIGVIFWIYYSSFTFVLGAETGQLYKERKLIHQS
jgi:membrane protein